MVSDTQKRVYNVRRASGRYRLILICICPHLLCFLVILISLQPTTMVASRLRSGCLRSLTWILRLRQDRIHHNDKRAVIMHVYLPQQQYLLQLQHLLHLLPQPHLHPCPLPPPSLLQSNEFHYYPLFFISPVSLFNRCNVLLFPFLHCIYLCWSSSAGAGCVLSFSIHVRSFSSTFITCSIVTCACKCCTVHHKVSSSYKNAIQIC